MHDSTFPETAAKSEELGMIIVAVASPAVFSTKGMISILHISFFTRLGLKQLVLAVRCIQWLKIKKLIKLLRYPVDAAFKSIVEGPSFPACQLL